MKILNDVVVRLLGTPYEKLELLASLIEKKTLPAERGVDAV